jgi:copper chaperone CopZ
MLFIFSVYGASLAQDAGTSKVIFYVKWFDVGKEALEGLKGVKRVEKGLSHFKEINTVYYDSAVITIEEMEMALKKAGTYLETAK